MTSHNQEIQDVLNQIAGLVLAGGQSTRMGGQNKALLTINEQTLLEHCLEGALHLTASKVISCGPHNYQTEYIQLPDSGKYGPLEGIVSGLQWLNSQSELQWLATVPCDTPFLPCEWLVEGAEQIRIQQGIQPAQAPTITAYYAQHDQSAHYATALWHRSTLANLQTALANGNLSLHRVLKHLNAQPLLLNVSSALQPFLNINSLADIPTANPIAGCKTPKKQPM